MDNFCALLIEFALPPLLLPTPPQDSIVGRKGRRPAVCFKSQSVRRKSCMACINTSGSPALLRVGASQTADMQTLTYVHTPKKHQHKHTKVKFCLERAPLLKVLSSQAEIFQSCGFGYLFVICCTILLTKVIQQGQAITREAEESTLFNLSFSILTNIDTGLYMQLRIPMSDPSVGSSSSPFCLPSVPVFSSFPFTSLFFFALFLSGETKTKYRDCHRTIRTFIPQIVILPSRGKCMLSSPYPLF